LGVEPPFRLFEVVSQDAIAPPCAVPCLVPRDRLIFVIVNRFF
jgi:hypothetical protein